jgi:hypothetical protein
MEQLVGKRMYRGLLKSVAKVWNPKDIQGPEIQQKVLAHMRLERAVVRPRQVRYQAALRPDFFDYS